jgi:hypothetical protein
MTHDRRYDKLLADCSKIESRDNRLAVDEIIDSARINANDTVRDEKLPLADWDRFFTATLASILSEGGHNHHAVAFFTKRGITF